MEDDLLLLKIEDDLNIFDGIGPQVLAWEQCLHSKRDKTKDW